MKKNEIALLILIIAASFTASYFIAQAIFSGAKNQTVDVPTVEKMTGEVRPPESRTFNTQAINPTVESSIGAPSNQQPLGN